MTNNYNNINKNYNYKYKIINKMDQIKNYKTNFQKIQKSNCKKQKKK